MSPTEDGLGEKRLFTTLPTEDGPTHPGWDPGGFFYIAVLVTQSNGDVHCYSFASFQQPTVLLLA